MPIDLIISDGVKPTHADMPNLIGESLLDAKKKIEDAGLKLGKLEYKTNTTLSPGTVVSQSVPPGSSVPLESSSQHRCFGHQLIPMRTQGAGAPTIVVRKRSRAGAAGIAALCALVLVRRAAPSIDSRLSDLLSGIPKNGIPTARPRNIS